MDAALLETLAARFAGHPERHPDLAWPEVEALLSRHPEAEGPLAWMEATGGEPDVTGREGGSFVFTDCSAETPSGRRSLCYDEPAWASRKENRPAGSAQGQAADHGVELLGEEAYRRLQALGEFDRKTSSWLRTPGEVRSLGGALFGDRRYGRVFTYHNGADSYYAVRGFRTQLRVPKL